MYVYIKDIQHQKNSFWMELIMILAQKEKTNSNFWHNKVMFYLIWNRADFNRHIHLSGHLFNHRVTCQSKAVPNTRGVEQESIHEVLIHICSLWICAEKPMKKNKRSITQSLKDDFELRGFVADKRSETSKTTCLSCVEEVGQVKTLVFR